MVISAAIAFFKELENGLHIHTQKKRKEIKRSSCVTWNNSQIPGLANKFLKFPFGKKKNLGSVSLPPVCLYSGLAADTTVHLPATHNWKECRWRLQFCSYQRSETSEMKGKKKAIVAQTPQCDPGATSKNRLFRIDRKKIVLPQNLGQRW